MRQQLGVERSRRSRWIGRCGALAAALLIVTRAGAVDCSGGPAVPVPDVCGKKLISPRISCFIPTDAQPVLPLYLIQRATNVFSWQAFIGLQWPASKTERGQPDPTAPIGAPGPTVWETWREANEVFRPDSELPLPWEAPSPIPAKCAGADRVLFRTSKVDDLLSDVAQPTGATATRPVTLKDQKSERTRYEIRINHTAYGAITKNQWWSVVRQANLGSVNFPNNSMIVKAAWIPIADGDAPRFRAIDACVCDSADSQESECALKKWAWSDFT